MNAQEKLNRQGQRHIQGLKQSIKAIWQTMCDEDGIPADSTFVVFSDETNKKYQIYYNNAITQLWEAQAQYKAGGYVGLRIVNGKAQ